MIKSAGILAYRRNKGSLEVFLVHPGGPLWAKKDLEAWSIPKGEFSDHEDALVAARREFKEETGQDISGKFIPLSNIFQKSGKMVVAFAIEADVDTTNIQSNSFDLEWPPKSGKTQPFPEIDKAEWFTIEEAKKKVNPAQVQLIDELVKLLETS